MTIQFHDSLYESTVFRKYINDLEKRITTEAKKEASEATSLHDTSIPAWPASRIPAEDQFSDTFNNLIQWKRHVTKHYDEHNREWRLETKPYYDIEPAYMLYCSLAGLLRQLQRPSEGRALTRSLRQLRKEVGRKHQLYLLLDESDNKSKAMDSNTKENVDDWLLNLRHTFQCNVERAKDKKSVVTWLYNITADLGIKPYK